MQVQRLEGEVKRLQAELDRKTRQVWIGKCGCAVQTVGMWSGRRCLQEESILLRS